MLKQNKRNNNMKWNQQNEQSKTNESKINKKIKGKTKTKKEY